MPTKKKSRAHAARTRMYEDLVLECAERVFAERGYHASRMQEIAQEAGISLSTLYGVFPGKEDVFATLHEVRGESFLARIEPAIHSTDPARETLWASVEAFVRFLLDHPDYFRVDLREGRSWALGDVEASPTFQKGIAQWTTLIERGIDEGVFIDEDPDVLATVVFGLMQLQLAALLAQEDIADPDEIAQHVGTSIERQLCRVEVLATPPPWESGDA